MHIDGLRNKWYKNPFIWKGYLIGIGLGMVNTSVLLLLAMNIGRNDQAFCGKATFSNNTVYLFLDIYSAKFCFICVRVFVWFFLGFHNLFGFLFMTF